MVDAHVHKILTGVRKRWRRDRLSIPVPHSGRWKEAGARQRISLALLLGGVFLAAATYGAFRFTETDRERDLHAWQSQLGIVADSRTAAVEGWLQNQFAGLTQIAQNTALQLYFTQITTASAVPDKAETDIARAGYLNNLLTVIANRMGFDQAPKGPRVAANVDRIGVSGIALVTQEGRVITATANMPSLQGRILNSLSKGVQGEPHLLDLFQDKLGKYSIGFAVPIFAVQAENTGAGQVGWVVGVKHAAAELFPLLKQPGAVWKSAEALLVRRVQSGVEYVSPTQAGDNVLGRIFAIDTPSLAAAYGLEKPGGFAIRRDYKGQDVLLSVRKIRTAPWTLLYKIDREEALGPSDERTQRTLIWVIVSFIAVIAIVVAAWRHGTSVKAARAKEKAETLARRYEAQSDFLKLVTDSQPAAMFIVDKDDRYKFANRVAAEGAGIGVDDLLGKPLANVLGPAAAKRYGALNIKVRDSGERHTDVYKSGSNGDLRVIQSEHIPIAHDEPAVSAASTSDIRPGILIVEEDITIAVAEKERRERTLQQLVSTLLAFLDRRDPHAADHSARVAALAHAVTLEMGLGEDDATTAQTAGQLMNLGKALVPSEILTRESTLTEDEMRLVRDSLQSGVDLLGGVEFDGPVVKTLQQINERWDGSGSPAGLSGDDILVTAQIVAASNAFVALTSERSWRDGTDSKNAAGQLLQEADCAFERRVVSALINLVDNREVPLTADVISGRVAS
jgi:HD-GYP domain-containing protein (c-di-GMP phosphodiesterase class II)